MWSQIRSEATGMSLDSSITVRALPVPRARKPRGKARVSNDAAILPDVDGRTVLGRRYRDLVEALVVDQGGPDRLSEAKLQLCRRFSAAAVLAEQMEAGLVRGEPINLSEHATLCSSLVRLAARIGINRVPRNVTPTLEHYLAQKHHQAQQHPPADEEEDDPP
jgi:hypothetical protein